MYAEPGKGAIHGAKDLRHGDVYLRLGLIDHLREIGNYEMNNNDATNLDNLLKPEGIEKFHEKFIKSGVPIAKKGIFGAGVVIGSEPDTRRAQF